MAVSNVFASAVSNIQKGSASSNAMIDAAPDDQKDFLRAQQQMQRESQIVQLITNLMKGQDDSAKAVLANLK